MPYLDDLPDRVANLVRTRFIAEFATVSRAGVPIDTPLVPFPSIDLETIDGATGLAYPAKAERIRNNPKVGMLFEGGQDDPVVLISGLAAVKDRDFQANLERYLSEEILTTMLDPAKTDYASVTRQAIWYFTRIIMVARPKRVRWWDKPADMDSPPDEWRALADTAYPQSDPPPLGHRSASPWKPGPSWRDLADCALGRGAPAHLTLIDPEGFPLPLRTREVERSPFGFHLELPGWVPWESGVATLTFQGIETFVGTAQIVGLKVEFAVQRVLPVHPLMADPTEILAPRPETRDALMKRIRHELDRRGATLPIMPDEPPEPTAGARLRAAAAYGFAGFDNPAN